MHRNDKLSFICDRERAGNNADITGEILKGLMANADRFRSKWKRSNFRILFLKDITFIFRGKLLFICSILRISLNVRVLITGSLTYK